MGWSKSDTDSDGDRDDGVMATMRARGDAGEGNTVMELDLMG